MSKKKQVYNPQREADMLDSEVRMDGVGESQLVKDLLSDNFVAGSDTQVAPIAMALAELLTGMKMNNAQMNTIMNRFEKIEKAQQAWEQDKKKFLEEIDKRSERLIVTDPIQKDKIRAEWAVAAKEAKELAVAEAVMDKLAFEKKLASEPKEIITSPGTVELVREGQSMIPKVFGEVIAIKNKKWYLPPGVPTEVPRTVAVRFREILAQRAVLEERKNLMKDGKNEAREVAEKWNAINERNKLGGDMMQSPI